jgi:hypothetical protein
MAARVGAERLPRGSFEPAKLERPGRRQLALFQYMIGNTDWSIARERNTMLVEIDGRQMPVPYDFDMSGLVNAGYAGPAPGLPIDEVRERYFLGYCQPGTDWERLFADFAARREAILSLGERSRASAATAGSRRNTSSTGFSEVIESAEERGKRIVERLPGLAAGRHRSHQPLDEGGR